MGKITIEMQQALPPAAFYPDGDHLYALGRAWLLVWTRPDAWIDPGILNYIRGFDTKNGRCAIDWRILTAKEIDYDSMKYLPPRHRRWNDYVIDLYHSNFTKLSLDQLRESAFKTMAPSLATTAINLSELFDSGAAKPVYRNWGSWEERSKLQGVELEAEAQEYVFRFSERIISAPGDIFRAFHDAGYVLTCPVVEDDAIPPMGATYAGGQETFGYIMPNRESGVLEDRFGRPLYTDATTICWMSEEKALALLNSTHNYPLESPVPSLGEILDSSESRNETLFRACSPSHPDLFRAVSALRWKGWADADIEKAYESGRFQAYYEVHVSDQKQAERDVIRLKDKAASTWEVQGIETRLNEICRRHEFISQYIAIGLGCLPEAAQALEAEAHKLPQKETRFEEAR